MYIPKRYGESKKQSCPFCNKPALTKNSQGVPVCIKHKNESLDLKCICGEWLDVRSGKWGPFFNCGRCGNISFAKAMEANPNIGSASSTQQSTAKKATSIPEKKPAVTKDKGKKEIVITSDEVDLYC
jgi:hypothetical protein